MAEEWYIMNTDHDTVSGFERESFRLMAEDAFSESLFSPIGTTVEICNYDLSVRTRKRVIIEGNLQDSKLNAQQRKILAPIGTCHAGQYVYYKRRYWLIIGLVDDNGVYEKGVMKVCNYPVTWRNRNGVIVQRWACAESASQYNNGETSNDRYFQLRSDQLLVLLPDDIDSISIPHGKRIIIDKRTEFYQQHFPAETIKDTSNPLITYNVTRLDNVIFGYQDSGHSQFMATQDEQHGGDGYYSISGQGFWLCEEDAPKEQQNEIPILSCKIECDEPIIYNGIEPTCFRAVFSDQEGNVIHAVPNWSIDCPFADRLVTEEADGDLLVSVNDRRLLNRQFTLSLHADGYEPSSIVVVIKSFM